jgi:hypothetical protein
VISTFTAITVTGTYLNQGVPMTGALTFTLTATMANNGVTAVPTPVVATLDATGKFAVVLYANDDTATVPQGVCYGVTEQIDGAQPWDYFITVPSATSPVDIATLRPGQLGWH